MDYFEVIFWIVIMLIWVGSALLKTKRPKPYPKEQPYEAPKPRAKPQITPLREEQKEIDFKKTSVPVTPVTKVIPTEKEKPSLSLSPDKLQEGIILSVILGPPKAYSILPEWRNGRRGSLKSY